MLNWFKSISMSTVALSFTATSALAQTSTLPWETSLQTIMNSLNGPVAMMVSTAAIIICGIAIMNSEGGGMVKRASSVGLGISLLAGATTILQTVFGMTGGATF